MVDPTESQDVRPHALYRFYGAGDILLYVGLTVDLPTRLNKHRSDKPWWTLVVRMTIEHHPDRISVEQAERHAIITERPLFNVQHNGRIRAPRVAERAPVTSLTTYCLACRRDVTGSSKAVMHVSMVEVERYKNRRRDWLREHDQVNPLEPGEFRFISAAELESHPMPAPWCIHCDDCNPHWDEGHNEACAGCYWFSLDRCRTPLDLLSWTAHLMGKNWLKHTDWDQLIYKLINGHSA